MVSFFKRFVASDATANCQMTHMILRLSTGTFQQYVMEKEVAEPENLVATARPAHNLIDCICRCW